VQVGVGRGGVTTRVKLGTTTRLVGIETTLDAGAAAIAPERPTPAIPSTSPAPASPAQSPVGIPRNDHRGATSPAKTPRNPRLRMGSSTKCQESPATATVAPSWSSASTGPGVLSTGVVSTMIG